MVDELQSSGARSTGKWFYLLTGGQSPPILRQDVLGDFCPVLHMKAVREHSMVGVGLVAESSHYVSILTSSFL